jgi:sugar phosphate isomerase/epimerase
MERRTFVKGLAASVANGLSRGAAYGRESVNVNQLTASTASFSGLNFFDALEEARRLKFGGIEILTFVDGKNSAGILPGAVVALMTFNEKQRALETVRRFPRVTTHLPFYGLYPATKDLASRNAALQKLHAAIGDSGVWHASVATLHAMIEPGQTLEERWADLLAVFRELGDHAAREKVRLGIETGWPNSVERYLRLIQEIDHPFVGATVDTGHIRAYKVDLRVNDIDRESPAAVRRYNDVLMQIVEGLGPKLFHFHADDVNAKTWRDHRTLGTGIVDWRRLVKYLSSADYKGAFALELEELPVLEQAERSRTFFERTLRTLE